MSFTRTDPGSCSVLVIDRDPLMLTAMGAVLNMQGYQAVLARGQEMAMQSICAGQFDVIVLAIEDLQNGCRFAAQLRGSDATQDIPIIFLVPELSSQWLPQLAAQGGVFSVLQPVDPYALLDLVERALWLPHVARSRLGTPATHFTQPADWIKLNATS